MAVPIEEFVAPTLEELAEQAESFFRGNKPKEYRRLKQSGELAETCQLRAKATQEYAESLIRSGEFPGPAWIQAKRSVLMESDTD